jgi:hypothetical protein
LSYPPLFIVANFVGSVFSFLNLLKDLDQSQPLSKEWRLTSTYSPSPLRGEGWGEGTIDLWSSFSYNCLCRKRIHEFHMDVSGNDSIEEAAMKKIAWVVSVF